MEYVSQTVVFFIALLGALFKCVKEDARGKTVYSRFGAPMPSRPGAIVLTLLVLSFLLSLLITWNHDAAERSKEVSASRKSEALEARLSELYQQNKGLTVGTAAIAARLQETTRELETLRTELRGTSADSRRTHPDIAAINASLRRIDSLLSAREGEKLGRGAVPLDRSEGPSKGGERAKTTAPVSRTEPPAGKAGGTASANRTGEGCSGCHQG